MSEPLGLVRKFYELLAEGDAPAALGLLDAEVEWTEAEGSPYYAGTTQGPDAVVAHVLGPIGADFEGFAATPSDFIAEGGRVVVLGRYTGKARATGRALSVGFVHIWAVENGKLRRFDQYTDSSPWNAALGRT